MTAPEHSPLPWHDDGYGITDSSELRAVVYGWGSKEIANRRLIISAVNSHTALLAAAKAVIEAPPDSEAEAMVTLRAAIAAAEEPKP